MPRSTWPRLVCLPTCLRRFLLLVRASSWAALLRIGGGILIIGGHIIHVPPRSPVIGILEAAAALHASELQRSEVARVEASRCRAAQTPLVLLMIAYTMTGATHHQHSTLNGIFFAAVHESACGAKAKWRHVRVESEMRRIADNYRSARDRPGFIQNLV
jgi:hypothetical protein